MPEQGKPAATAPGEGSPPSQAWHAMAAGDVLRALDSTGTGLGETEAGTRRHRFGPNILPAAAPVHPLMRFLAQFNSALIYFLLAASVAAAVLGHLVDAGVIFAVVLANAIVGFVQEGKAQRALTAIQDMLAPQASVIRDGARRSVAVTDLVPGDIVLLEAGARVPADLRLLRARGLLIDEAALTGESVAAEKDEAPVAAEAGPADQRCMAFSGTLVAAGQGTGVVTGTGVHTQLGRISELLQRVPPTQTPLLMQIDRFAHRLTVFVLIGAAALFLFAVMLRGFGWAEALVAVVAVAVGVVPEGLPAVITITLAIGVQRMAARKAMIRRLPAVETLGATSVICTDKTGTLTRNEMMVRRIFVAADAAPALLVEGEGYAPHGDFIVQDAGDDAAGIAAASSILRAGVLCNDARLVEQGGAWRVDGDPMEGALLAVAGKAGLDADHLRAEWPRVDEIPFDAAYRYMATLHRGPQQQRAIFIKGAPEAVMALAGVDPAGWSERISQSARQGERLLGFAWREADAAAQGVSFADLGRGVRFLGLMGFIDPPRMEAGQAIAECRSAGVTVKMITGDHPATAAAIAQQLGLSDAPQAVTGEQLQQLSDEALAARVAGIDVFARTTPEHKLRIVRALQSRGQVVAMTGDGVNDAPALKQADVGTAMGIKGTEAAKEAAQMVLLDDNFASIVAAVREGRTVYDNIRKVVAWTLPTNGGETLAVVAAILAGFALPMTATQILWVNLVTGITLGLVLAFEPPESGTMERMPRKVGAPLLSGFMLWRVVLVSVLMGGMSLWLFFHALRNGRDIETARTIVVNALVVFEIFYLFNVRYLHMRSLTLRGAMGTRAVLIAIGAVAIAQSLFTYAPFMQAVFDSRALHAGDALRIGLCGVGLFLLLEIEKVCIHARS